jgi:AcrR family transcriptional regulator
MKENAGSKKPEKARRGDALRQHILWTARDVFLEMGFERASMDVVANRANTSKRSLYAHFQSKEKLFQAFMEVRRELFLGKLKTPGDYSKKPAEALVMFCGRYLEIMIFELSIQLGRVSLAETARFPEAAVEYFDVAFTEVELLLAGYLKKTLGMASGASVDAAQKLLGQVLYPRFIRALFGMDKLTQTFDLHVLSPAIDLKPIRKAVADVIGLHVKPGL